MAKQNDILVFGCNDSNMLLKNEKEGDQPDDILRPLSMDGIFSAVRINSVSLGSSHSIWLSSDGSAYTVGCNSNGQCGFTSPDILKMPKRLDSLADTFTAILVTAGGCHTAILTSDGHTALFGANDSGQCGHGDDAPLDIRKPKLLKAPQSRGDKRSNVSPSASSSLDIVSIGLGDSHTLLLDMSARVYACGQGRFGALGLGDDANRSTPTAISALAAAPIKQVACGERHSAVLTFGGAVFTFGWSRHGALGAPAPRGHAAVDAVCIPRLVPQLRKGVLQIACGGSHTLALATDGKLFGFGRGGVGGTPADAYTPAAIALPDGVGGARVCSLSAGRSHSLALLDDGRVLSWGSASSGQVGLGDTFDVPLPALLFKESDADLRIGTIAAGGHSSVLLRGIDSVGVATEGAAEATAVAARAPATLTLDAAKRMSSEADWHTFASLVQAVFSSAALCNASFAHEAPASGPAFSGGGLRAAELEGVYKQLLGCYDRAPEVVCALRDSIPALLDDLEGMLRDVPGGGGLLVPPSLFRGSSSGSSSFSSATNGGGLLSSSAQRAYRDGFVLSPLAVLIHNPLLSHASEAAALHRIARLVDESLSPEARHHLAELLSRQPSDIFAARVVRPLNAAIERAFTSCRQGGQVVMRTVVQLVRLLGLAREANDRAKRRRQQQEEKAHPAGIDTTMQTDGPSSSAANDPTIGIPAQHPSYLPPGSLADSEFYNGYISEHLDCERDYVAWVNNGVQRRSEPGSDPGDGFSFCSESWILSPQAKAKLLQVESSVKMQSSAQQAIRSALMRGRSHQGIELLPSKRRRRNRSRSRERRGGAGAGGGGEGDSSSDTRPPPPPDTKSPYLILRVRRSHLIEDSLDALAAQTVQSLLRPLRVIFEGEPAIDEGGVRKEFFQLLVDSIFSQDFGMYEWSEEARCFWFSRASASLEAEAEYLLVGLVIGLAIHNGVILDLRFPPLLWMRLMNEPVGLDELKQIAPDLSRGLESLLAFDGDVESAFMADFSVVNEAFGAMSISELKPDGANIAVTNENREEYARLYADHLLVTSVEEQFGAFMKGFLLLCDGMAFSLLTPTELEQLVCGVPHLDFHALQANTQYDAGFHAEHPTVRLFWEVLHSLGTEDQRRLLFFATGCDRAPLGGLGKLKFILQRGGDDSMDLPTAHTCFNMLTLPEYTSRGKMRDRLTIAIRNATGFGMQ